MNKFLADLAETLNPFIALFLIYTGARLGSSLFWPFFTSSELASLQGAVIGLIVAVVVCGLVAQLASIRRLLGEGREPSQSPRPSPTETPTPT